MRQSAKGRNQTGRIAAGAAVDRSAPRQDHPEDTHFPGSGAAGAGAARSRRFA